jgi:hypothetical protein
MPAKVLCPMNRGGLGARSLNIELQKELNPPGEIRIERFGWIDEYAAPAGSPVTAADLRSILPFALRRHRPIPAPSVTNEVIPSVLKQIH